MAFQKGNGEKELRRRRWKNIVSRRRKRTEKEKVENICLKEEKKNGVGKGGKYPKKARLVQCSSCG